MTVNDSSNFVIDGAEQAAITLISGQTYEFDVSGSTNDGHPFRFSTTSDGTHASGGSLYSTDVTYASSQGSDNANEITTFTAPAGNQTLYYYCDNHHGMGGSITIQNQTFKVTVNKYGLFAIDGAEQATITLTIGRT